MAEAYCKIDELYAEAVRESGEDQGSKRPYLEKVKAWVKYKANFDISLGQAESVDRAIGHAYEEFKKKLPALPPSLGITESSPGPLGSSSPLTQTLTPFEPETNSTNEAPVASSPQNDSLASFFDRPAT